MSSMFTSESDKANAINELAKICHKANHEWWFDLTTGQRINRNVGELLCLIHSEISEALEGYRKNMYDSHIPTRTSMEVELADALIRIFDFCGGFNLDLGGSFVDKMKYNSEREDHKLENRRKKDGKKF